MSNALAVINNFDDLEKTGGMMSRSGLFKDSADAFKAMVKIQAGQELGVPPFQAMAGINIIHGKPVLSAGLLASLIKNHADYDYKVGDHTELECVIVFIEKGDEAGVSSFSIDDAKRAGVFNTNPNWKKYPKNMLFARALSNGAKWYCAGIFGGSVYVEGEIVEAEPVRVVNAPNMPKTAQIAKEDVIDGEIIAEKPPEPVDNWAQWFNGLSTHERAAALGKWADAVDGIPRYDSIHALKAVSKKLADSGTENFLLMIHSSTSKEEKRAVFECRHGLYMAIKMYAEYRQKGLDEFSALKAVHAQADSFGAFSELLKPIATDDFDDIASTSNATQTSLIPSDDKPVSSKTKTNAAMM